MTFTSHIMRFFTVKVSLQRDKKERNYVPVKCSIGETENVSQFLPTPPNGNKLSAIILLNYGGIIKCLTLTEEPGAERL